MKKSIKLLAVLATIASLTACENLGEKVEYNEGIKQQAHYEKNVEKMSDPDHFFRNDPVSGRMFFRQRKCAERNRSTR